jgi:hypothetical protein
VAAAAAVTFAAVKSAEAAGCCAACAEHAVGVPGLSARRGGAASGAEGLLAGYQGERHSVRCLLHLHMLITVVLPRARHMAWWSCC